jgi:hypothetical protein
MPSPFRASLQGFSMLTTYFKSSATVARYQAGSAGPYLDQFIAWLADHGYRRASIRRHVREVVQFAAWSDSSGAGVALPDQATLAKLHDDRGGGI